ncbi:MAG: SPFH/Band 7/PHB domain protein [Erysipelotrichaceae bacterium]|jgi:regulator of protease activity HflC (stomatin/prohibitin superfamily)|nr:SPFH/Band 7/PHB domain protein [Erysipelotrichaceae bacterium]
MFLADVVDGGLIALIVVMSILGVVILAILFSSFKIVRQGYKVVIERLGKYHKTWDVGFHFLVPFFDRKVQTITMKEQVRDFDPQSVITKDNVTMQIDTVVYFQVTDPKQYAYGVEYPISAIENLSATTLRNIIGDMDLDETLTSRDQVNNRMRIVLDEATDAWGIKVNRVELKNILPPKDIRDAMERQMRAERERREKILLAEGEKTSAILIAEGRKQSMILNAEAEKESKIRLAEGEAESIRAIKEAEANSVLMLKEAEAKGLELIKNVKVTSEVIELRGLDTLAKVADGQATKIIIPSDISKLASVANIIKESIKE